MKIKFDYFKVKDIYEDLQEIADNELDIDNYVIVSHLLRMLRDQRGHMSILSISDGSNDKYNAISDLWSYIEESSKVTIPMINLYNEEMDSILKLDRQSSSLSEIDKDGSDEQTASKDSSLSKENDTPGNLGADLTSDAYLSFSSRTEVDTGKRERITRSKDLVDVTYKEIDNIARVRVLGDLEGLISNIYQNWLDLIDRAKLVYYEH